MVNMLRVLRQRESGITDPLTFRKAETTRRCESLELSKHLYVAEAHHGGINSLDLDVAEHRYLLSGDSDSNIVIHDTLNTSETRENMYPVMCTAMHSHLGVQRSVETVQWYPVDTGVFTSSGANYTLNIWDTNRLKVVDSFEFKGPVYSHHMSQVAKKHSLIAVGVARSTVQLVDIKSGSAAQQLKGHGATVYTVQWSPKEEFQLASGSVDNKVILWDVRMSKGALVVLDQHGRKQSSGKHRGKKDFDACYSHDGIVNSVRFTGDGLHLLTFGSDNQVRLWDTCSGRLLPVNYKNLNNPVKKSVRMEVVGSSFDSLLLVPSDSVVHMYRLFTGQMVGRLDGHYSRVNCCVWHPDTQYLFSGGSDRNILVWTPTSKSERDRRLLQREDGSFKNRRSVLTTNNNTGVTISVTADSWSSDDDDDRS